MHSKLNSVKMGNCDFISWYFRLSTFLLRKFRTTLFYKLLVCNYQTGLLSYNYVEVDCPYFQTGSCKKLSVVKLVN